MTADGGEFSFHEMEKAKRALPPGAEPGGQAVALAPSGRPTIQTQAHPQEFFSRGGQSEPDALAFRRLVRTLSMHKFSVLALGLLLPLLMYVYDNAQHLSFIPDAYRAWGATWEYQTGARFEHEEQITVISAPVLSYNPARGASLNLVMTRAEFYQTGIADQPGFYEILEQRLADPAHDWTPQQREAVRKYLEAPVNARPGIGRITLGRMNDGFADITVVGTDQHLLPPLANAVVPALNNYFRRLRLRHLDELMTQHYVLKDSNQQRLDEVQRRLVEVNRRLQPTDPVQTMDTSGQTDRLEGEQYQLLRREDELRVRLKHLKMRSGFDDGPESVVAQLRIDDSTDLQRVFIDSHPLRAKMAATVAHLTELRMRYRDEHPSVQHAQNELALVQEQLRRLGYANRKGEVYPVPTKRQMETLTAVLALEDQINLNRMMLDELDAKLEQARRQEREAEERMRRAGGEREPDENALELREEIRAEISFLRSKSREIANQIMLNEMVRNQVGKEDDYRLSRVASNAVRIRPNVVLDSVLAGLVGIMLGLGMAFLLESMDNHIHTPSDVYYHLGLNYLGVIPLWSTKDRVVIEPEHADSHIAEVYAHLCNNIRYGRGDHPEKRLLIASATPGEGKSTISANIATRYAQEGNTVVLIDADLRRPRGHKLIDIFSGGRTIDVGLSNYLNGEAKAEEVAYPTSVPGLTLIPAGGRVRNAAKLLGDNRMAALLDWAEATYDIVIVDCPAVLPVVDATILAPLMRGVLVVVAAKEAEIGAIRMSLYRLSHVGSITIGAVLNKVQEISTSYSYYGWRYRGGYYGPYSRVYYSREPDQEGGHD